MPVYKVRNGFMFHSGGSLIFVMKELESDFRERYSTMRESYLTSGK